MLVELQYGDISYYDEKVDVIVNAWNRNFIPHRLLVTHGVSKAIKKRSGLKPFDEVQKKGMLKLGEAVLTSPGKMKCKGIIHVAGIGVLWNSSEKAIRLSVRNAMNIVKENNFKSVAFPLIGCGENRFSERNCITIITDEVNKFNIDANVIIVKLKDSNNI